MTHSLSLEQLDPFGSWLPHEPARQRRPTPHSASTVHETGQVVEAPEHTYGEHAGEPGLPAALVVHTPGLVGRSQESHEPLQAVSQHRPSTQKPEGHVAAVEHAVPPSVGSYSSAQREPPLAPSPPANNTFPLFSRLAEWLTRPMVIVPPLVQVLLAGS